MTGDTAPAGKGQRLTVAVTGPTGQLGTAVVTALEREEGVARILGMARRPFDLAARGWDRTEYRPGDVLDRPAVDELVAGADVVVHLAFVILGWHRESAHVNLAGSRNVFEAAAAAGVRRLVYTSSLAAYGYHARNPVPLAEDVPARGSREHYYSRQKAACEALLAEVAAASPGLEVYVMRPCIVAGPQATLLADSVRPSRWLPGSLRRLPGAIPGVRPVLPDPGVPFQLVHPDDVATAVCAAVLGAGPPGPYNLAADGQVTVSELAHALGVLAIPVPWPLARIGSGLVALAPWVPAPVEWIHTLRHPMLMDTGRARRELGWTPRHTAGETLVAMADAVTGRTGGGGASS